MTSVCQRRVVARSPIWKRSSKDRNNDPVEESADTFSRCNSNDFRFGLCALSIKVLSLLVWVKVLPFTGIVVAVKKVVFVLEVGFAASLGVINTLGDDGGGGVQFPSCCSVACFVAADI